jgi:polar amino acid transport system substrate-binding protein
MKKKLFGLLVISMIMAGVFAGCGTKEDAKTDENAGSTENTDTTNDASTEEDIAEKLIVGTEAGFAPYEYMEGDKVVGIDMDIVQAIADSLGRELEIKNMDFDGALMAVQNGTVDLVAAGVSVDEERQKVMDFSIDYVNSTEVVVVNKENPTVSSVEDLNGKIVGVQQGNIADFWVEENIEAKDIKRYTKFAQATEDLKNGRLDCIVMDKFPAEEMVAANPELVILDGTLFEDKYAIAVQKGNTELLEQINTIIQELKDNGKIEEFTANHTGK